MASLASSILFVIALLYSVNYVRMVLLELTLLLSASIQKVPFKTDSGSAHYLPAIAWGAFYLHYLFYIR